MYFSELASYNKIIDTATTFTFQVQTRDGKYHHSSPIPADGKNAAIAALLEWAESKGNPWLMWGHTADRQTGMLEVFPYEEIVCITLRASR